MKTIGLFMLIAHLLLAVTGQCSGNEQETTQEPAKGLMSQKPKQENNALTAEAVKAKPKPVSKQKPSPAASSVSKAEGHAESADSIATVNEASASVSKPQDLTTSEPQNAVSDTLSTDSLPPVRDIRKQMRILSVGNSYARDAFSYVPFILNELLPGLDLQITIMYYPGRPLSAQWTAYENATPEYQRDTYTTAQGRWKTEKSIPLTPELDSLKQWDIIVFQQASGSSPSYDTYKPHLGNLVRAARAKVPQAKVGWLLTPAHPDGYRNMPVATSMDMWKLICEASKRAVRDEKIDILFPAGTAIQNARQTPLDSLGNFGHMSFEGLHLQDGIPCLIEALTIAQQILNYYHIPLSITASNLRPTQQWAEERKIPEMNGKVLEGTEEDYNLCKRIALYAVGNPYNLGQGLIEK